MKEDWKHTARLCAVVAQSAGNDKAEERDFFPAELRSEKATMKISLHETRGLDPKQKGRS